LQFGHIHLALAEPLLQRGKGGVGEQGGHARDGQHGAGGVGAADADCVVVQRGLEALPQPGEEAVKEGGEMVPGGFG